MFDTLQQEDIKQRLLNSLPTEAGKTVGEALDFFTESGQTVWSDAIRACTFKEIADAVNAKGKKTRAKAAIPSIQDWKDEAVQEEYRVAVLDLINETGLGDARGLAPIAIRKSLGRGSEQQARDVLQMLEASGDVVSTGTTRGKRYVPASMLAAATAVHEKEVADRKAAEEAAAARKAEKDAEAAS